MRIKSDNIPTLLSTIAEKGRNLFSSFLPFLISYFVFLFVFFFLFFLFSSLSVLLIVTSQGDVIWLFSRCYTEFRWLRCQP